MNNPKDATLTPEADRVIARYGIRPSKVMRETLRATLELQREAFRTLTRHHGQKKSRDHGFERER